VTERVPALAVLVVFCLAAACAPDGGDGNRNGAIPFNLKRPDGSPIASQDLHGRYALLDFWATWCPPCVLEIPEMNAVYERFRDRGLEVLAISVDDLPPSEIEAWLRENGVGYPVALGSEALARRYGAFGFPFHVLLSPEGEILERLTPGFHDREELGAVVARHLPG
jgi:thiol-disulfide isomerase/thioredoxin